MTLKIFQCGNCEFKGTRHSLRAHLREEHFKKKELTNFTNAKGKKINQPWWKTKEFK